jgi:very-short-patch-repair endonuclease
LARPATEVVPASAVVTATIVGRKPAPRVGVRIHCVGALSQRDVRIRSGLTVTSPARTVIDFAADATTAELERAIADGLAQRFLSESELGAAIARAPSNHRGAAITRALLSEQGGAVDTRSGGERQMLKLIREAGLPAPLVNTYLHGYMVDLYWPDAGVVVELDSFGAHGSRPAFERDRRRDQVLAAAGIVVIRVSGRQLEREPLAVIVRLAQALAARAAA